MHILTASLLAFLATSAAAQHPTPTCTRTITKGCCEGLANHVTTTSIDCKGCALATQDIIGIECYCQVFPDYTDTVTACLASTTSKPTTPTTKPESETCGIVLPEQDCCTSTGAGYTSTSLVDCPGPGGKDQICTWPQELCHDIDCYNTSFNAGETMYTTVCRPPGTPIPYRVGPYPLSIEARETDSA